MLLFLIQQSTNDIEIPGTPLTRLLIVISVVLVAIILYQAYHKWLAPKNVKESEEYRKNKYKDIDGC